MNDAVLIQQAAGAHIHLLNLTVALHSQYAQRHGFDYWPIYGSATSGDRHAFWSKVALILKAVDAGCRYVVWLDADCYIADDAKDLRDACPLDGIGATWHAQDWSAHAGAYDHWNAGALYTGVGVNSKQFLRQWWKTDDQGHPWHDQHSLNLCAREWFNRTKREPPIVTLGHEWNTTPFFASEHPPIVAAWHGCNRLDERLEMMREYIDKVCFGRALESGSQSFEQCVQRAEYCEQAGNHAGAIAFGARALCYEPQNVSLLVSVANSHIRSKQWQKATGFLRLALTLEPTNGAAWRMLSGCYSYLGEQEACGSAVYEAVRHSDGAPATMLNKALFDLKAGDWTAGFDGLRWDFIQGGRRMRHPSPEWDGKRLTSRLFVWAEQGIGDTLMLLRFLPLGTVTLEIQAPLVALLQAQEWPDVTVVAQTDDHRIPFDFDAHVGLFSLPRVFGATPQNVQGIPYLDAPQDKIDVWAERMSRPGPRVGFSWAGSRAHGNDIHRSMEPEAFDGIVSVPGAAFYCLQRDIAIPDEARTSTPSVTFLGDEFADLSDTAGALANLDLVITVDSAIAHLAGAMGVKCWVLLSKSSDWRWLTEGAQTVWYNSVTLYRQETLNEWGPVMERVENDLKEFIANGD